MYTNKRDLNLNIKISAKIFNTLAVLKNYCDSNQDCEEVANLTPIVCFLYNEADKIHFNLRNIKCNSKERAK